MPDTAFQNHLPQTSTFQPFWSFKAVVCYHCLENQVLILGLIYEVLPEVSPDGRSSHWSCPRVQLHWPSHCLHSNLSPDDSEPLNVQFLLPEMPFLPHFDQTTSPPPSSSNINISYSGKPLSSPSLSMPIPPFSISPELCVHPCTEGHITQHHYIYLSPPSHRICKVLERAGVVIFSHCPCPA